MNSGEGHVETTWNIELSFNFTWNATVVRNFMLRRCKTVFYVLCFIELFYVLCFIESQPIKQNKHVIKHKIWMFFWHFSMFFRFSRCFSQNTCFLIFFDDVIWTCSGAGSTYTCERSPKTPLLTSDVTQKGAGNRPQSMCFMCVL